MQALWYLMRSWTWDQGATRNKFCWLRNCSIAKLLVAFLLSLLLLFCWCCFFAREVCCFFAGCCFFADHFAFLFCFVAFLLGTFHCFFALLLFCLNEQQSNTSKKATSSIEQKSNTSNKATDFFSKKAMPWKNDKFLEKLMHMPLFGFTFVLQAKTTVWGAGGRVDRFWL